MRANRPPDEASTIELEAELWALLRAFERASAAASRESGVTAEQLLLLRAAEQYEWIAPLRLARILCRDPGAVRAEVRLLATAGLARLRRATEARGLVVALTASGRALAARHSVSIEAVIGRVLRGSTDDTVAFTRRLVVSLRGALTRQFPEVQAAGRRPPPGRTRRRIDIEG